MVMVFWRRRAGECATAGCAFCRTRRCCRSGLGLLALGPRRGCLPRRRRRNVRFFGVRRVGGSMIKRLSAPVVFVNVGPASTWLTGWMELSAEDMDVFVSFLILTWLSQVKSGPS